VINGGLFAYSNIRQLEAIPESLAGFAFITILLVLGGEF
jgi:hypothetical protein